MRVKIFILGLICFFVFAYCESPVSPDIPEEVLLPAIEYFIANPSQISYGESSTLSWSTVNTWKVLMFCDDDAVRMFRPGVCVVEKTGTMKVWPERTTFYRLVASGKGSPILQITPWLSPLAETITVEVVP
ncbi:hypothetical protein ES707_00317 [subsurface metagenome]